MFQNRGSFGKPTVRYYGPGSGGLTAAEKFNSVYDPILGKGIVLGKYSRTTGGTKDITDYDKKEIAGPQSQAYKDALYLASTTN